MSPQDMKNVREIIDKSYEFAIAKAVEWLETNIDLDHDYPNSKEELIEDFKKAMGEDEDN